MATTSIPSASLLGLAALLGTVLGGEATAAGRVAVVYSVEQPHYAVAATALVGALAAATAPPIVREFALPAGEEQSVAASVKAFGPTIVAVVGTPGIAWAEKHAGSVRVVTCLTLDAADARGDGTYMRIAAEDNLRLVAEALSRNSVCGVLYSEQASGGYIRALEEAAKQLEMRIECVAVEDNAQIGPGLQKLRTKGCTVVLGIADGKVYGGAQAMMILKFCHQYRLAFVGISLAFAKAGALLAFYATPEDQGQQAAGIVLALLQKPDAPPRCERPRPVRIALNVKVKKQMGAKIDPAFEAKVDETCGE